MICAKPGSELPSLLTGQEVYVLVNRKGLPLVAGLNYTSLVKHIGGYLPDVQDELSILTIPWVG